MNYGYIKPKIDSNHYILGGYNSLPKEILQPDGQWDKNIPSPESQERCFIETYNCTSFGTLNVFEILFRKMFLLDNNFSDRFLGIKAGTTPPGNDPHIVIESARKSGFIKEQSLPFSDIIKSWSEYYSYKGGSEITCTKEGLNFLKTYDIGHEWVFTGGVSKEVRLSLMKEALKYSPLGVSVSAWNESQGLYIDLGQQNNHWTVIYGYDDKGWKCFDSYEPYLKTISYDHNIEFCKRYSIKKIATQESWFSILISNIKRYFKI